MLIQPEAEAKLKDAVRLFWMTRDTQAKKQGGKKGTKDTGARAAVTGGAQMSSFNQVYPLAGAVFSSVSGVPRGIVQAAIRDLTPRELPL